MTVFDATDELSDEEIDTLAAGIEAGTVDQSKIEEIATTLADANQDQLERVAEDKPAVEDLAFAVTRETDVEIPAFERPLVERANVALEGAGTVGDLRRELSDVELQQLADEIRRDDLETPDVNALTGLLRGIPDEEAEEAVFDSPALRNVFLELGLPDPITPVGEAEPEEEPDVTLEEEEPTVPEPEPERAPEAEPTRRRAEGQRPSPFGAKADKEVARNFFGGNQMKGQAWIAAEQERLSERWDGIGPGEFWDRIGEEAWGNVLTREGFVNPQRS